MRLLRARDHRTMPWKNGGGVTIEVAISPSDATLDTFDWRLSLASVASDGPFSMFPGVDRTLVVLDGAGLRLTIARHGAATVTPLSEPLPFPADQTTTAALINGAIVDLNVMTRRGRYRHTVERLAPPRQSISVTNDEVAVLLCGAGELEVSTPLGVVGLELHDAVILPSGQGDVGVPVGTTALLIRLTSKIE